MHESFQVSACWHKLRRGSGCVNDSDRNFSGDSWEGESRRAAGRRGLRGVCAGEGGAVGRSNGWLGLGGRDWATENGAGVRGVDGALSVGGRGVVGVWSNGVRAGGTLSGGGRNMEWGSAVGCTWWVVHAVLGVRQRRTCWTGRLGAPSDAPADPRTVTVNRIPAGGGRHPSTLNIRPTPNAPHPHPYTGGLTQNNGGPPAVMQMGRRFRVGDTGFEPVTSSV